MVKIQKVNQYGHDPNGKQTLLAELFADSKSDDLTKVANMGADEVLAMGSSVLTADGDFALLNSSGEWNWL